jgi:spore maturation protein CgeB
LPPPAHADFYSSLGWTLNITRADMVRAGHSPSVRLFEATACSVPVISDRWRGLNGLFEPGNEVVVADTTEDVIAALNMPETARLRIGSAGRRRTLLEHTGERRAQSLEALLQGCVAASKVSAEAAY